MMRFSPILVAVLLIFADAIGVIGKPLMYTCQVTHVYELSGQGALRVSAWEKDMKGSSFTVDRLTGRIIGSVLPTFMAKYTLGNQSRVQ